MVKEDLDLTSPIEGQISPEDIDRMVEDLVTDEVCNRRFIDVFKTLRDILTEKFRGMVPCELEKIHRERFSYQYPLEERETHEV